MSKTKKAEKKILKFVGRKRTNIRLTKVIRKNPDLPMTFAIWNLVNKGELKRTRQRGIYARG